MVHSWSRQCPAPLAMQRPFPTISALFWGFLLSCELLSFHILLHIPFPRFTWLSPTSFSLCDPLCLSSDLCTRFLGGVSNPSPFLNINFLLNLFIMTQCHTVLHSKFCLDILFLRYFSSICWSKPLTLVFVFHIQIHRGAMTWHLKGRVGSVCNNEIVIAFQQPLCLSI